MRKFWLVIAIAVAAIFIPTIALAATGSFTSSSSTSALTVKNYSTGRAVLATAASGQAGYFARTATTGSTAALEGLTPSSTTNAIGVFGYASSTGTGKTFGVYGRTNSRGTNASGVFGFSNATTGLTNGVLGQANPANTGGAGVYGTGFFGVAGQSTGIGDGSFGLAALQSDLYAGAHVVEPHVTTGDFAGTCAVAAASATQTCTFAHPFQTGVVPVVVISPQSDPGLNERYWVSYANTDTSASQFTIDLSAASTGGVTFNYIVVGILPSAG